MNNLILIQSNLIDVFHKILSILKLISYEKHQTIYFSLHKVIVIKTKNTRIKLSYIPLLFIHLRNSSINIGVRVCGFNVFLRTWIIFLRRFEKLSSPTSVSLRFYHQFVTCVAGINTFNDILILMIHLTRKQFWRTHVNPFLK